MANITDFEFPVAEIREYVAEKMAAAWNMDAEQVLACTQYPDSRPNYENLDRKVQLTVAGSFFMFNAAEYTFGPQQTAIDAGLEADWRLGSRGVRSNKTFVVGETPQAELDNAVLLRDSIDAKGGRYVKVLCDDLEGIESTVSGGQWTAILAHCSSDENLARTFILAAAMAQATILPAHAAKTYALNAASDTIDLLGSIPYYQPFNGPELHAEAGEDWDGNTVAWNVPWNFSVAGNRTVANANGFTISATQATRQAAYLANYNVIKALCPVASKVLPFETAHVYEFAAGNRRILGDLESGVCSEYNCEPGDLNTLAARIDQLDQDIVERGATWRMIHSGADSRYIDKTFESTEPNRTVILHDADQWEYFRANEPGIVGTSREDPIDYVAYMFRNDIPDIVETVQGIQDRASAVSLQETPERYFVVLDEIRNTGQTDGQRGFYYEMSHTISILRRFNDRPHAQGETMYERAFGLVAELIPNSVPSASGTHLWTGVTGMRYAVLDEITCNDEDLNNSQWGVAKVKVTVTVIAEGF